MPFLSASFSYDQLPLKKHGSSSANRQSSFGGGGGGGSGSGLDKPDVYPQQPNQKEDHFYSHVKMGFQNPPLDDEHKQSNKRLLIDNRQNVLKCLADLRVKRDEQNSCTLPDSKKKFMLNKDRFWPYHFRVKPQLTSWMNDLSCPTKDLYQLGRRIPSFQRKEELLIALAEHQVPMVRAIWTIKLDAHHKASQKDEISKKKSRGGNQAPDIGLEWTQEVCKFMSNVYKRMLDHEHRVNLVSNEESYQQQCSLWNYTTRLVKSMFEEGLLDKHEFLSWLLQAIQCDLKPPDDPFNPIFIPLIYGYLDEIVQNESLSRRLAFFCCRGLTEMYENSVDAAVLSSLSPSSAAALNPPDARLLQQQQMHIMSSLSHKSVWEDYQQCGHHRAIITSLACALQVITLCCPSALIWVIPRSQVELLSPPLPPVQPEEEGTSGDQQMPQHVDEGSPLDYLAVSPSELPLPFSAYSSATSLSELQQDGTSELCAEVRDQLVYAEELIRNRSMAIEQRWSSAKYQESSFGNEVQRVLEIIEQLDIFDFHQTSEEFNMKTLFQSVFKKTTYPSSSTVPASNVGKNSESSDWLVVKTLCDWSTSFYRPGCHRAAVVAAVLSHYQLWVEAQDPSGSRHHFVCQKFITKFLDGYAPTLNHPPGHESNTFEEERTFASLVLLIHELIDAGVFSHDLYMRLLISRGDLNTGALFSQDLDSSDDYSVSENTAADGETEAICDFTGKRHLLYALHFPVARDNSNDVNQRLMLLYGFGTRRDEALASQNSVMRQLSGLLTSQHSEMPTNLDESSWADIRSSFLKLSYNDRQNVVAHCYNQIVYQLDSALDNATGIRTPLPPSKAIDFVMQLSESAACVSLILDIAECILSAFPAMDGVFPTEYSNALAMTAVSAMENYMPYLLIADQMAATLFESVVTAVEGVKKSPSTCSSAERCLLHLLEHMLNSSNLLKQSVDPPDKYDQLLTALNQTPAVPKFQESRPQSSSASEDSFIAKSFLEKPSDVDEDALCQVINRIHAKENFRSVLISSALIKLCDLKDSDDKIKKANDLSLLCMELTSRVPFLKTDWFTAVTIICSQKTCGNNKTLDSLVKKINIENNGVYDSLVLFICYMVSRHLFKLEEVFVKLIHSILAILNVNSDSSGQEREIAASTRLSMYVLLKLLHANQHLDCLRLNVFEHVHSEPDRLLLAVQMRPVNVGLLVAILKAFATHVPINTNVDDEDNRKSSQFEPNWTSSQVLEFVGSANLQEVACGVLHALASCTWITYSCLRNPGILKADEILLDPIGGERLASHILQLLCYPGSPVKGCRYTEGSALTSAQGSGQTQVASAAATAAGVDEQEIKLRRIFEKLNKWNHRSSWLQFTIILELCEWKKQVDLVNLLARLSIQIFDIQPVVELRSSQRRVPKPAQNSSSNSTSSNLDKPNAENATASGAGSGTESGKTTNSTGNARDPEQAWLVAPLIGQLPAAVQGAVLNQASSMLDRGGVLGNLGQNLGSSNFFSGGLGSSSKPRSDKEKTAQKSIQLLSHGPFLSLVLTCLKGQDDQRESLLSSLQTQFSQMIKEQQHIISLTSSSASNVTSLSSTTGSSGMSLDEIQASRMKMFNDEWQLRLSLLGSMFDSILRNQSLCTDWIVNLVNLLEKDIINPVDNPQLFYTVVDMLIVLIEFNSGDHPAADEQSKKSYNSSVKKIRNIIGDKQNEGLRMVRQLLPLQKCSVDVVCCEPVGTVYDSKGNKIENSHLSQGPAANKYQGNQIVGKQKLSPWDLIEGFKIQAPLQLNWFNAVRMERGKPSVYEEQARAMFYHDHSPLERSQSYFMQPIETPKSGGPNGAGVSDDDDVQVEAPPSASTPTPTSASAPKSKSRYNKSGGSTSSSTGGSGGGGGGGNKKQTKSRKKTSQQQQQQQLQAQQPVPVVAPPATPMGTSVIPPQSYTPAPTGSAGSGFTQQVQSIPNQSAMQQQSQARFMGGGSTGVSGGGGAPTNSGIVVQNNPASVVAGQQMQQVYFQQQQQAQQPQSMSNIALANPSQIAQMSQQQMLAPPQAQQATPRQQLTKHLKNKNQQQAAAVMRGAAGQMGPQGNTGVGVMGAGGGTPARMPVPQTVFRQSFPGDSSGSFGGGQPKPGASAGAMMSTGGQGGQQMVYVQQSQPAQMMSQQGQQPPQASQQFVQTQGAPQGYRFASQQQMMQRQLMLQQQRQHAMQFQQQQQSQQGGQFSNPQFTSSTEQQQSVQQQQQQSQPGQASSAFMRAPPPYN